LVFSGLLTLLAAVVATRLEVDSDLRRLLPEAHPVVQGLEQVEAAFGSTGTINIVVRGPDATHRRALADAFAAAFEGQPSIASVEDRLPSDFFVEHALYYLSDAELEQLDELIQAWSHYEFCSE